MESNTEIKQVPRPSSEREIFLLRDGSTIKDNGLVGNVSYCIPTLTFLNGDALGKEIPLVQQQLTIGRGEDADIIIMEPSVSRRHVELTYRKLIGGGGKEGRGLRVVIRDLDSKNGTLVNYRRIRRSVLRSGDKIALGRVILRFDYRDVNDQLYFEEIYRMATTDHLTGLLNKTTITRILGDELMHLQRYRRRMSIILIDFDDFKSLNDTYGHLVGDRALQITSQVLQSNLRVQDRAGRFGGEEFLLVLPETGLRGALALAERIRKDLAATLTDKLGLSHPITVSMGVASFPLDGKEADSLLERADAALYRAKGKGRNRVEAWRGRRSRAALSTE